MTKALKKKLKKGLTGEYATLGPPPSTGKCQALLREAAGTRAHDTLLTQQAASRPNASSKLSVQLYPQLFVTHVISNMHNYATL